MWLFTRGYPWLSPNSFPMFSLILVIPDTWQIAQGHSGDPWVFDRWIQLPILELDGKDRGKVLESLRCWGAVHLAAGWDKANVRPIRWKPGQTWQIWVNLDFSWHVLVTLGKSWRFKLVDWLVHCLMFVVVFFFRGAQGFPGECGTLIVSKGEKIFVSTYSLAQTATGPI